MAGRFENPTLQRTAFVARGIRANLEAADAALDRVYRLLDDPNDTDGFQAIADLMEAATAVMGMLTLEEMRQDDERNSAA